MNSSCTLLQVRVLGLLRTALAGGRLGAQGSFPCHMAEVGTETFESPVNNASNQESNPYLQ